MESGGVQRALRGRGRRRCRVGVNDKRANARIAFMRICTSLSEPLILTGLNAVNGDWRLRKQSGIEPSQQTHELLSLHIDIQRQLNLQLYGVSESKARKTLTNRSKEKDELCTDRVENSMSTSYILDGKGATCVMMVFLPIKLFQYNNVVGIYTRIVSYL